MARGRRRRGVPPQRRRGSFTQRLEDFVLDFVKGNSGTPSTFALAATEVLGQPVTRQAVSKVLADNDYSRKTSSIVPRQSVPRERREHLLMLRAVCTNADMLVFVDEKKFRGGAMFARSLKYGYAPVGQRLPLRRRARNPLGNNAPMSRLVNLPKLVQVIGAISTVANSKPMLTGKVGNVGLICCAGQYEKFTAEEIVRFVEDKLAPLLNAFPGPQSVVVMDNMPEHRRHEQRLVAAVNARGALLIWNPPQSPDLNPIEKLWDVVLAHANLRLHELLAGTGGQRPRAFHVGDLQQCLDDARLTLRAYNDIFFRSF